MKKLFRSFAVIFSVFLLAVIVNTFRFGDFRTTLEPAGFIQEGDTELNAYRWPVPVVYDWDGDGRKDLIIGHNAEAADGKGHGRISFFRNTGRTASPEFDGPILLGECGRICSVIDMDAFG